MEIRRRGGNRGVGLGGTEGAAVRAQPITERANHRTGRADLVTRAVLLIPAMLAANLIIYPAGATAQNADPATCSECHDGEADATRIRPPHTLLADSVHHQLECGDCHESIDLEGIDPTVAKPHGDSVEPVDCSACHEDETDEYVKHGRLDVGNDPDIPECWDCHGAHEILPSSDRRSHVHPVNLPSTCRACHTDVDLVEKHRILRGEQIKLYERSVHGQASKKGLYAAATCNDCHAAQVPNGRHTAHRILSPTDPDSTIYHFTISETCGQCHGSVTRDYVEGIHGQLVELGRLDAPVCTTCHGEHGIISPHDANSPVSAARVAEQTCTPCHESVALNENYGVPAGKLRSYVDSYHGHKSKAGDVRVANCASCHGAHRILPHTDLTSSIHPNNLQETCGECHPGISAELAGTSIHEPTAAAANGWPHAFTVLYLWFIGVVIGLMLLHNGADWIRSVKRMNRGAFVMRLSPSETAQHWVLMISFAVLVLTGFALRYSEAWWVRLLFGWGDGAGFLLRGTIHRVAAVVMIAGSIWHVFYLMGARGRRTLRDMMVGWGDLTHVRENVVYFLGAREERPRFGRFSYVEKCEYWALMWGTVIMIVSGILLWFDDYFVTAWGVPKVVLDVMLVVHFYEAWLASLAILVWHVYGTVLSPSVYPMNPSWIGGRMPTSMYAHEHPAGPTLTSRVVRPSTEEEVEVAGRGATANGDDGEAVSVKGRHR